MLTDVGEVVHIGVRVLQGRVGDPDVLQVLRATGRHDEHGTVRVAMQRIGGTMNDGHARAAVRIVDHAGEDQPVLVPAAIQVKLIGPRREAQRAQALPRDQVAGDGKGNAGMVRRKRGVGHDVQTQGLQVRHTGVFHAAAQALTHFVRLVGLQCVAQPLRT